MDHENNKPVLDPFINWSHNFGRAASAVILVYMFLMPTIICTVYGCFPPLKDLLTAALPICALFWPINISEAFSYPPILGSSSYLTFITGNVMNLKLPCAISAQKQAGTEPNTPEGDAVALLANSVSSLVTMVVILLGVFLMVPLKPLFETPFVKTAVNYMMPAMFGCLVLVFVRQNKNGRYWIKNKLLIPIVPAVLSLILYIVWKKAAYFQGFLVIGAILICMLVARILWKKGIVRVVVGPDAKPYGEAAPTAHS